MARQLLSTVGVLLLSASCAAPNIQPTEAPSGRLVVGTAAPTIAAMATPAPSPGLIPQPAVPAGIDVAPDSARVDLAMPAFSDPSNVDNSLFPVSAQESVLMLGHVDGKPFRTEVTLLADHRVLTWAGQQIEALVSQYNAYVDGRIEEVAYDYYAQDDAGNVWYLGEDIFDFVDGAISGTHGTWLAGKDAPGAMIMPAHPRVGDVFRTENAPPLVFEEVTVTGVDQALDGPLGTVAGGIVVNELHLDGASEDKQFAPSYGEFYTSDGKDLEALALAVPADRLASPVPAEVVTLTDKALAMVELARAGDWDAAATNLADLKTAWRAVPATETPSSLRDVIDGWLHDLTSAIGARDPAAAQRAAIETARAGFDLQLRHRPAVDIDLARMDLWAAEIRADADNGDTAGVNSDAFAMDYVRDRIQHRIADEDLGRIDARLEELGVAQVDADMAAIADIAASLREDLAGIHP